MALFEQISEDIQKAMKARDKVRLETLRNIKKVFLEAATAPGADGKLADDKALKIIQKLVKQGEESAATYRQANRPELAEEELAQVAVMKEYLPKPLSAEEIESVVAGIITQTGAQGMKDMGRVMGMANKQMAGKADGKQIADIVRKLLNHKKIAQSLTDHLSNIHNRSILISRGRHCEVAAFFIQQIKHNFS